MRILLEQQPGWQVAGEAADALELLTMLDHSKPDLVLIDWQLPGLSHRELLKLLRLAYPHLFLISLSGRSELRQAALAAGADMFVSKTEPPGKLIALIQELAFDYLDAPVLRVTAPDIPIGFSPTLQDFFLPDEQKIVAALRPFARRRRSISLAR